MAADPGDHGPDREQGDEEEMQEKDPACPDGQRLILARGAPSILTGDPLREELVVSVDDQHAV
jgi:hypothetical protein